MPNSTNPHEREQQDIDKINETVLKALEMLMGSGGHKSGIGGLSSNEATKVLKGVVTDHRHEGYKDVTMQAFQNGLQRILDDFYVSATILTEGKLDNEMLQKLVDEDNRKYILKIMGFSRQERQAIEELIKNDNPDLNPEKVAELIQNAYKMNHKHETKDRLRRIDMMTTGTLCYLPFAEPNDGHQFKIPVKDQNGHFHREPMKVTRVNMSPGIEGPYYALNLQPVDPKNQHAQEHMLFMGTNPLPTASGFSVTVHADTITGNSIGENFVEASSDRLEKMINEKFKSNIKNLLLNHRDQFVRDDGTLDKQKLWLAARVKCTGQSLGGSISLQMLVKFPHMVEISAFEPPFLLEKHKTEMERNLTDAHDNFNRMVSELEQEAVDPDIKNDLSTLKGAVPKHKGPQLEGLLAENNEIIAQMIDYATKYGVFSPPAKILHVDTKVHASVNKKDISAFDRIKDFVYRRVMAFSVMSHAMVLAGQNDKQVVELYDLNKLFDAKSRQSFTKTLDQTIWKAINKPISKYIKLKAHLKDTVYDPTNDPKSDPRYKLANANILADQIDGKWQAIHTALNAVSNDPNSWQGGEHLIRKIDDLSRMLLRAENLEINTSDIMLEMKELSQALSNAPQASEKIKLYVAYLNLKSETANSFDLASSKNEDVQRLATKLISDALDKYVKEASSNSETIDLTALSQHRQEIVELYNFLDQNGKRDFINQLSQVKDLGFDQSPHIKLIEDLRNHSKNNTERSDLKTLQTPKQPQSTFTTLFSSKSVQSQGSEVKREEAQTRPEESSSKRKPRN